MLPTAIYVGNILWDQKCKQYYCYDLTRLFDCFKVPNQQLGPRGGTVGWDNALQAGRPRVRFPMVSSLRLHCGSGVDSESNRNEYQEYFLGVKVAGAYSWQTYRLHVPIVLKSGSLNLLESSGLVQACNGTALSLTFSRLITYIYIYIYVVPHR